MCSSNLYENPFSLFGKRILITGATSGIGKATAIECAKLGASLIITGRNSSKLAEAKEGLPKNSDVQTINADFTDEGSVDFVVDSISGQIDGVVHSAGFIITKPLTFLTKEDASSLMNLNFGTPFFLTQKLIKKKKLAKGSSIVFISSISGVYISAIANSLYSASKGAINGMSKGMAIELAPKGIRVNCVNPGMIDTGIFSSGEISSEQFIEDRKKYPLGRYGLPHEVAHSVIYLLSDATKWITGTNLVIDGGFTLL